MLTTEPRLQDPFTLSLPSAQAVASESLRSPDRAVARVHDALAGQDVLLTVSGSIAAYKAPTHIRRLRAFGANVGVRITENAEHFIGLESLRWAAQDGQVYSGNKLSGEVEHLRNYSLYLVAPASYDFINAMASGRADTPALTTMATALGRVAGGRAKMLVLPCMNGDMSNPILHQSIQRLLGVGVSFLAPRMDGGKLEDPGSETIAVAAARELSTSPLKGMNILVTAGPTPVPIDDVRRITNKFQGKLGLEISKELVIKGANPRLLLGGALNVPDYMKPFTTHYYVYDEYKEKVLSIGAAATHRMAFAVLSAAVADYAPEQVVAGKIASNAPSLILPPLAPTQKVVELLHSREPDLPIVSFKLLSRISVDDLIAEARSRTGRHSKLVVANRLEDVSSASQTVYLVTKEGIDVASGSKQHVAQAIVGAMEKLSVEARR